MASFLSKLFGKGENKYEEKTTTKSVKEAKLKLEELPEQQKVFIQKGVTVAAKTMNSFKIEPLDHIFAPQSIDKAIEIWITQKLETKLGINVDTFSKALACGWGQYLVDNFGMKWHIITDDYGTDIGLYHKNNDTTIFPFNSIPKAISRKDFTLISTITSKTKEIIELK